jgi:exodeoxyribonuclease VII large subunit
VTVDDYTSLSSPDDMTSVLTVSQITAQVKSVLDGTFRSVLVEGEISNFLHHSSGHMYFTLKDDKAELRAVMFQGDNSRLKFVPEGGMKVLVRGKVTVYEARGVYQIIIKEMETAGLGALYLAFEALKKKLASEGLFEEERKRPLPPYPTIVGVITSWNRSGSPGHSKHSFSSGTSCKYCGEAYAGSGERGH